MNIKYKKKFLKVFEQLKKGEQKRVKKSISLFQEDIFHPLLHNHSLTGKFSGCRSLNAGGNLRLIFQEKKDYIEIIFLDLGAHSELY